MGLLILLFVLAFSPVRAVWAQEDGQMSVHAIYLEEKNKGSGISGYGDAVLVESGGEFLLMDTGCGDYDNKDRSGDDESKYITTSASLIAYLKQVGAGTQEHPLDVYISHVHTDHYGGMQEVLEQIDNIRNLYLPHPDLGLAVRPDTRQFVYDLAEKYAAKNNVNIIYLSPSGLARPSEEDAHQTVDSFTVGGARCDIIGPAKIYTPANSSGTNETRENNNSLCAMLSCSGFKFLTMGDAQAQAELDLIAKLGSTAMRADLLKQDHHGYDGTYPANHNDFIKAVRAKRSFACVNRTITFNTRIYKQFSTYGEVLNTHDAKSTMVYQKNPAGAKVERSLCSHPLSHKTFKRVAKTGSYYEDNLTITCSDCGKSETITEYHGCSHKINPDTGQCDVKGCSYLCPHFGNKSWWKSGKCIKCGYHCRHCKITSDYQYMKKNGEYVLSWNKTTRKCSICGISHNHKWIVKTGKCKICKAACKHTKWNAKKGRCRTCGYWCPHSKWNAKTGKCKRCGFRCIHCKRNNKTHRYYTKNGKKISVFNKKTGICKTCRYKCRHPKKKKGKCLICGKKIK